MNRTESRVKKVYNPPRVVDYGKLRDLTGGSKTSGTADGASGGYRKPSG